MQSLIRLAVLAAAILIGSEVARAGVVPAAPASSAVAAGAQIHPPLVFAQTSNNSSGSSSTRIPRGAIRLAIFAVVALVGAAGWVVKKMTAGG